MSELLTRGICYSPYFYLPTDKSSMCTRVTSSKELLVPLNYNINLLLVSLTISLSVNINDYSVLSILVRVLIICIHIIR